MRGRCLHLWPLDVTTLPNGARSIPHRFGRRAASLDEPCQDNSEVTESLLPSCCQASGAKREANVVLFLGKSLITGYVICNEHLGAVLFFQSFKTLLYPLTFSSAYLLIIKQPFTRIF